MDEDEDLDGGRDAVNRATATFGFGGVDRSI